MIKKLFFTTVIALMFGLTYAQTTCGSAQPFCSGGTSGVNFPASVNQPAAPAGPNYGCLYSQPNPAWYYVQVQNSGNIVMQISGTGGGDVDFVCWGPFSSLTGVCTPTALSGTCSPCLNNSYGGGTGVYPAGNMVDCSYSANPSETCTIPSGVTGQYYMVLITNYSNMTQNITFNQIGGSGTTNCSLLANNSQICAGQTATITANNSSNLTSPQYSINPGGVTSSTPVFTVNPTTTTNYTVYVTGYNTSSVIVTQTVISTVTVNPQPSISPTVTQPTCISPTNSVNLNFSILPSGSNYTVTWAPTPGSVTSNTQTTATNLNPGVTSVTVTGGGSCSVSANFSVNSISSPTFNLLATTFSLNCYTSSASLSVTTSYGPPTTVYWVNSTSTFTSNATGITIGTYTAVGNYSVSMLDAASGCATTQTFAIGQNTTAPTNTLSGNSYTLNCLTAAPTITNTIVTPTANATTTWAWTTPSPGSTTGSVTNAGNVALFTPIPGTITVMSCNTANGCCNTKTITVTSTSAYPTFNPASSTNFTLGCSPVNTTTLYANNATSPGFPLTYTFIPPTASPSPTIPLPPSAVTSTAPSFTTSIPGTWTIVVMDGVSKCQTAIPVTVIQNTFAPNASYSTSIPSQTLTCYNSTFAATGISTNSNTTIQWLVPVVPNTYANPTVPIGILATGPATAITAMSNYATYTLQVTDNNNKCISTQTMQVMQSFRPPINLQVSATASVLTCVILQTQLGITTSGAGPWYVGSGPAGPPTWLNPPSPSMTPSITAINENVNLAPATYTALVQDGFNGCIGTFTRTIFQNTTKPIAPNVIGVLPCGSATAIAKVNVVLTNTLSNWNIGVFTPTNGAQLSNPALTSIVGQSVGVITGGVSQYSFTINQTGVYGYTVVNNTNGCVGSAGIIKIVPDTLSATFAASTLQGFAPLPVTFTNTTGTSSGNGTITSVWAFGNGSSNVTSTSPNASTTYLNPGTYTVMLTSASGTCVGSSYKIIVVDIPSNLTIPNVFTPNGDNVNDVFFVKASNLTDINALIYDRWGNVVYQLDSNTGNISWDGKNPYGKDCAEGTYFYVIKATGKDGASYEKKGNVSLFR
ncbi:MAG: gliding motility-associated C-terminal domain-containing protein [Bacteroidetes bacterium]|nr:gliding motility-associated C-terminal domain-containing protein [Bacteroidota bacterium]